MARKIASFLLLTAALAVMPAAAHGQIADVRRRAEEAARLKARADSVRKAAAADSAAKATGAAPDSAQAAAGQEPGKANPQVWENYDFVPGSKVLFFTDFSEDRVGNFARRLKYVSGPLEVVDRDGEKVLRSQGRSTFLIPVGGTLPERFTMEIDLISPSVAFGGYDLLAFEGGAQLDRGDTSVEVNWHYNGTLMIGSGRNAANSPVKIPDDVQADLMGNVAHIRVLMDGAYFKMYTNERRMYNIPELTFRRDSVIRVFVNGSEEPGKSVYITGIRLAESETDVLYDALAANGRWATQGILFETGKADLKPESRPVLVEIAETLAQHADLNILIEGHTDNVGSPVSNLALSEARAAAVKAALVSDYGADAGRISTAGLGDTKPAVPNTTAEGRAQNRRVEVVKT
jgi:outer membrane protein OmpA-like peptidoglycan-associated protein/ABC-type amino acid transport substrate-binding protein